MLCLDLQSLPTHVNELRGILKFSQVFCILIVAFISRANSNVLSLDCFVLYFAQLELSFHFIVTLTAFYFVYYVYITPIKLFFHFDFFFLHPAQI